MNKWQIYELLKNGKQSLLYNIETTENELLNSNKNDLIEGILEYIFSKKD